MKSIGRAIVILSAAVVLIAHAGCASRVNPSASASAEPEAHSDVVEMDCTVERHFPHIRFEDCPLREVVAFLTSDLSMRLHVDWDRLQQRGIDPQTPITLNLRMVRTSALLAWIADAAGNESVRLAWIHIEGIEGVTLVDISDRKYFVERRYEVSDLCVPIDSPERLELVRSVLTAYVRDSTEIVEDAKGNGTGSIAYDGTSLIVWSSPASQQRVSALLQSFRGMGEMKFGSDFGCFADRRPAAQ